MSLTRLPDRAPTSLTAEVARRANEERIVRTDSKGGFTFGDLRPGVFILRVVGKDLVPSSAARIMLREGQSVSDVLLGPARFASITGVVRDNVGDPVVDQFISAFLDYRSLSQALFVPRASAVSDDRGHFRLSGLTPGEYLICACGRDALRMDPWLVKGFGASGVDISSAPSHFDETVPVFAPTYYPRHVLSRNAVRVVVNSGETLYGTDIDLTAQPGRRVLGRLNGGPSRPGASLSVMLFPEDEDPAALGVSAVAPVELTPDGRFQFSRVVPGRYTIEAFSTDKRPVYRGMAQIVVGVENDVVDVEVPVYAGVAVAGRLEFLGQGLVPPGQELSKGRVGLVPVTLTVSDLIAIGASGSIGYSGTVQADGSFVIPDVPPGTYRVTASGFGAWYRNNLVGPSTRRHTVAVAEKDYSGLIVNMTDAPRGVIEGTAAVERYEVGATVVAFPENFALADEDNELASLVLSAAVTATGTFTIRDLLPGDYFVALMPRDQRTVTRQILELLAKTASRVSIRVGSKQTLNIRR